MTPRILTRFSTYLDLRLFSPNVPPIDLDLLDCSDCRGTLDRHQPDEESPCRLLGICQGCGRWYLILVKPDMVSALIVGVPEDELFRSVWDEFIGPDVGDERAALSELDDPPPGGTIEANAP